MDNKGWISLYRSMQSHPFWVEDRVFSKAEAWLDILMTANHSDNKFLLGSEFVEVPRGSFITSELKLISKWKWSKTKVRNYLKLLQSDGMITKNSDSKKTTITVVRYCDYQDIQTTKEPQEYRKSTARVPKENQESTERKPREYTNNNDNNYNNENNENNENNDEQLKSSKPKTKVSGDIDFDSIKDAFNQLVDNSEIPSVRSITEKRKRAIKNFLKENTLLDFREGVEKSISSDFLSGKNGGTFKASFDWLMNSNNCNKVLEGNYENSKSQNKGFQFDANKVMNSQAAKSFSFDDLRNNRE